MSRKRSKGRSRLRACVHWVETPLGVFWMSMTYNLLSNDLSTEVQNHPKSIVVRLSPYMGIGSTILIYYGVKFTIDSYFPEDTGRCPEPHHPIAGPAANPDRLAIDLVKLVDAGAETNDNDLLGLLNYVMRCARENGDGYQDLLNFVDSRDNDQSAKPSGPAIANGSSQAQSIRSPQIVCLGNSAVQDPAQLADSCLVVPARRSEQAQNVTSYAHLVLTSLRPLGSSSVSGAQTGTASSAHMVLTIDTKDSVTDVKRAYVPEDEGSGSRLLYRRIELGPQIGELEIDKLRVQIMESMELARKKDEDCTLQFGSFAVLRYTDTGPKWWKLPKDCTPTIHNIQRSPWSLLDFLPGRRAKWTIRGYNLQNATLRATTTGNNEDLKVLDYYKTRSKEDVFLCEEPHLVRNSAPMFQEKVYICASKAVEVEMGASIKLQSEVRSVKRAYWNSAVRGLIPGLSTMIMIAILSLLGEMRSASHGGHNGLSPNVASVSGHKHIAGLQLAWSPILSSILRETYTFCLIHIFIMVLSIIVFTLWRLSHDNFSRSGFDVPSLVIAPGEEGTTSSSSPAATPWVEDNLSEDTTRSSWPLTSMSIGEDELELTANNYASTSPVAVVEDTLLKTFMLSQRAGAELEEKKSPGPRLGDLPQRCIESILRLTTPRDVARLACVNRTFYAASFSDLVWETMLPPAYVDILDEAQNVLPSPCSKKEIYDFLCNRVLLQNGTCEYWLDRATGGICQSIGARGLALSWGDDRRFWDWERSRRGARSTKIAYLKELLWLHISGRLECFLSPGTYTLSWRVFHQFNENVGPVKFSFEATGNAEVQTACYFTPEGAEPLTKLLKGQHQSFVCRWDQDNWMELDVGEFLVEDKDSSISVMFSMLETTHHKKGLYLDGVMIRPSYLIANEKSSYSRHVAGSSGNLPIRDTVNSKPGPSTSGSGRLRRENEEIEEMPENFQYLPKEIVGIDHVLEEVKGKLQEASSLGLVGMGGIGKTTLAKALFKTLKRQFEYACFLENVSNIKDSVADAILQHTTTGKQFAGTGDLVRFLTGKRLLLVIDDTSSDLDVLPTLIDVVHQDSRFIVTSRDAELLSLTNVLDEIYHVPFLSPEDSKELFKTYAFGEDETMPPPMQKHADMVVEKCEGLPLSLEVIGKYLRRQPESIWVEAMKVLDREKNVAGLNDKLWAKLRLSYDGLDETEQNMFLDAATIFYNEVIVDANAAWSITTDGFQYLPWQHLLDLSLVRELKLEYPSKCNGRVGMHEVLMGLGRKIASTLPAEHGIRIWDKDEAKSLLTRNNSNEDDVKDIVALKLNYDHREEIISGDKTVMATTRLNIMGSTLYRMRKLRYLSLGNINIDDGVTLPSTLVYLSLDGVNFSDLLFSPSNYDQMAVLSLVNCSGLQNLPTMFGELSSLQVLSLCKNADLESLPDSFGSLVELKHLTIEGCIALEELPESIGGLVGLRSLKLKECHADLPESLWYLPRLSTLEIDDCSLRELPDTIGDSMARLETLRLSDCSALSVLPDSFGKLRVLHTLEMVHCSLGQLPDTFGKLGALERLSIRHCTVLSVLPDSFGSLVRLKTLEIVNCSVHQLPETFGDLTALESLSIRQCCALSVLPISLGSLPKLRRLEIVGCPHLQQLPDTFLQLQALEHLSLAETTLQIIPNLENLRSLKTLALSWVAEPKMPCPTLPTCLREVITATSFDQSHFTFDVLDGEFIYSGIFDVGNGTPQQSRNCRTELRRRRR